MGKQRRQFSAGFKAKVALEAIKGQRTVQEIASTFSVHPNQIAQWKRQGVDNLAEIFTDGRRRTDLSDEELKSELRDSPSLGPILVLYKVDPLDHK